MIELLNGLTRWYTHTRMNATHTHTLLNSDYLSYNYIFFLIRVDNHLFATAFVHRKSVAFTVTMFSEKYIDFTEKLRKGFYLFGIKFRAYEIFIHEHYFMNLPESIARLDQEGNVSACPLRNSQYITGIKETNGLSQCVMMSQQWRR